MISSYEKVLTLCLILVSLLTSDFDVVCSSIFKNVDVPIDFKMEKSQKIEKMTKLMTS